MSAGAAASAANLMMAINAIGGMVKVSPDDFLGLLQKQPGSLVIHTTVRRSFSASKNHQYLTNYKGFGFYTTTDNPLSLRADTEVIEAEKIWPMT